jgi:hypothetical protein
MSSGIRPDPMEPTVTTRTLPPSLRQAASPAQPLKLRAAASSDSGTVHLAQLVDHQSAPLTLCGTSVADQPPRRLLMRSACHICITLALLGGATFAHDHGAYVNLQRLPLRATRRRPTARREPTTDDHFAEEIPADPVPLIEKLLDDQEAAGIDRLAAMAEVLGSEAETPDAWLERLRRNTTHHPAT